jgi:hypothetical protein
MAGTESTGADLSSTLRVRSCQLLVEQTEDGGRAGCVYR